MLYLVATPIGNLSDITFRALEILKTCDYILCEDTRHSAILLRHYSIEKPLKSFHKFSESAREEEIIEDLTAGKVIALISDAGTPGISDPGSQLVQRCIEKQIKVSSAPGPCAAIAAISISGLSTDRFQFFGFLPKKTSELERALQEILIYSGTTICYESPNRLIETLEVIDKCESERLLVVVRELTKKFEEVRRGTAKELLKYWSDRPLKGEIVLLIAGAPQTNEDWQTLSPAEHVELLQKTHNISLNDAIKLAAQMRNVRKRDLYNLIHKQV